MRDNGEYFCRAQNSEGFGRDSLPFYVLVKGKESSDQPSVCPHTPHFEDPIQFLLKPNSSYLVEEADQLVIPCLAYGRPIPSITWFKVKTFD